MIDRITHIIEYLKQQRIILSQAEFSQKIGIKPSQLSEMLSKKRIISERTVHKIANAFPDINAEWLLTGEGEMLKSSALSAQSETKNIDGILIPILPIAAQGGSLNDFNASIKADECEKVISPIRNVDFAMPVTGDSMSPEYPNGSQILIKKIDERAFIEWGKVYVLDTRNGSIVKEVRQIKDDESSVMCHSLNPDPKYAPFAVQLADVFGMYRVVMCMSLK